MKKLTAIILVFIMIFTAACGGSKQAVPAECTTKIHFICISKDNGAMDCILLESQGRFGLVDCGYWDQREQITYSLAELGVTQDNLDFIIGTHAHADHIGAMNFLIQNYNVERIYLMPFSADCLTEPEEWTDESWDNVMRTADKMGLAVVDTFEEGAGETPWLEGTDESGLAEKDDSNVVKEESESAAESKSSLTGTAAAAKGTNSAALKEAAESSDKTDSTAAGKKSSAKDTKSAASKEKDEAEAGGGTASKAESTASANKTAASEKADSNAASSKKAKAETDSSASAKQETVRPANHYTADPHFTFGDARIDIYNYSQDYLTEKVVNANDTSLVVKVTAGGHTALLTGDLSNAGPRGSDPGNDEEKIADLVGHVDILKLSHHGYGWYDTNTVRDLKKFRAGHIVQTGATNMLFTDKPNTYDEIIREVKKGAEYVATFWYDRRVMGGDGLYAITYDMKDLSSNIPDDVRIMAVNRDGRSVMFKDGKLADFVYDDKTYLSDGTRHDYGVVEVDGIFYEIDNNCRILKVLG